VQIKSSKFGIRIQSQESNSKFQVPFSVDRFTQSGNFEDLLELKQTLLLKEDLNLMDCYTSVKNYKYYGGQ
jgi:hypothetical protein